MEGAEHIDAQLSSSARRRQRLVKSQRDVNIDYDARVVICCLQQRLEYLEWMVHCAGGPVEARL